MGHFFLIVLDSGDAVTDWTLCNPTTPFILDTLRDDKMRARQLYILLQISVPKYGVEGTGVYRSHLRDLSRNNRVGGGFSGICVWKLFLEWILATRLFLVLEGALPKALLPRM